MQHETPGPPRCLSDADLAARLRALAAQERGATADLLALLAELDTREIHLREGYGSLFVYCRDALALSEHDAYNRIAAARAARRFPVIFELVKEGALNLTGVKLLAPHLTLENHRSVLESARGKRKLEVEQIVAALAPWPDVPAFIRKLPPPRPAAALHMPPVSPYAPPHEAASSPPAALGRPPAIVPGDSRSLVAGQPPASGQPSAAGGLPAAGNPLAAGQPPATGNPPAGNPPAARQLPATGQPPAGEPPASGNPPALRQPAVFGPPPPFARPAATVTPLAPDRYKVQLTVGSDTLEKLRLAKDMLRHAIPSGDDAAVFDRALTALLAELARSKFAATDSPRPARGSAADSRHIPAEIKRAVWLRDFGCCAFVAPGGRRCGERAFLEFHHVQPYAAGGQATTANIQLRCRRHNGYEARAYFRRDEDGRQRGEPAPGPR